MTIAADRSPIVQPLSRGTAFALYGAGFFSIGLVPITVVLVPLRLLELGASPAAIGLAMGLRALLPAFLSIHAGVLMDRLGCRRILVAACLLLLCMPPLYLVSTSVVAVTALQLLDGLGQAVAWIAAQTQITKISRGEPRQATRFAFAANSGTFLGPLLAGLGWDWLGSTACFALLPLWSVALLACALPMPQSAAASQLARGSWMQGSTLLPRVADYRAALALIAVPIVAVLIGGTLLRMSALSAHQSLFPVYLASIGMNGTMIGILISLCWLVAAPASFLAAPATRRIGTAPAFVLAIAIAIVAITLPPLFTQLPALALITFVFGAAIGLTEPLVVSLVARGVEEARQGMSFGLRATANRVASLVVPVVMGGMADLFGFRASFFVVGGVLLLLTGALALLIRRLPAE